MILQRKPVAALGFSAVALTALLAWEGFSPTPYIPTQGDVPTIGHGATRYEDGTPVTLSDPPISRQRAIDLALDLAGAEETAFRRSLEGAMLTQSEYDVYLDFVYQFGIGNWRKSSMRQHLLAGRFRDACNALLAWRRQDGRDCSKPVNWGPRGCKGVWTRQLERHEKCLSNDDAQPSTQTEFAQS